MSARLLNAKKTRRGVSAHFLKPQEMPRGVSAHFLKDGGRNTREQTTDCITKKENDYGQQERKSGEADKYKSITHKGKVGILKLMSHDCLQFILCQICPFLAIRTDMKLCEWITGNLAVVVCPKNDPFQLHTTLPDGCIGKTAVRTEIDGELLDELWGKFQHRHVRAAIAGLYVVCYVVA